MIKVEYLCDDTGDYTVPFANALEKRSKEFETLEKALDFSKKCTCVLNLDELYNVVPKELMPDVELINL